MNQQNNILTKVTIGLLAIVVSILLSAIPFAMDLKGRIIRIETKMEVMSNMALVLNEHAERIARLEERSRRDG